MFNKSFYVTFTFLSLAFFALCKACEPSGMLYIIVLFSYRQYLFYVFYKKLIYYTMTYYIFTTSFEFMEFSFQLQVTSDGFLLRKSVVHYYLISSLWVFRRPMKIVIWHYMVLMWQLFLNFCQSMTHPTISGFVLDEKFLRKVIKNY